MPTLVIVGAQWGDEAKGKLVDALGSEADVVIRYSGGNNAGHTVIVGDEEFKFHLIPAGILHPNVTAILGGGMVVCPQALLEEFDRTRAKRPELGRLLISPAAHVVFPFHRMLDRLEEQARGVNSIGTTSRGIGPAYQDKVARFGIRFGEFVQPDVLASRLHDVVNYKNRLLAMHGEAPVDFQSMYDEYAGYAERLRSWVADTDDVVYEAMRAGKRVLFEGAQGTFLDLDSGTYPYVTSSHPVAGGACIGTGIGPRDIDGVLAVCKAYTTRVGSGPFPTELEDAIGQRIRDVGREYGTSTGRPRRCGWLDLVLLRTSARLNSLSGWVLTRLDVLSGLAELKVATHYRVGDRQVSTVPQNTFEFAAAEPVYTTLPGWEGDISGARSLGELPQTAQDYLRFVEEQTGVPIQVVSIGPERDQTIWVDRAKIWG